MRDEIYLSSFTMLSGWADTPLYSNDPIYSILL